MKIRYLWDNDKVSCRTDVNIAHGVLSPVNVTLVFFTVLYRVPDIDSCKIDVSSFFFNDFYRVIVIVQHGVIFHNESVNLH